MFQFDELNSMVPITSTALDPAAPLVTDKVRLNRDNAVRVHTLQTNAGVLGDLGRIGHVDMCVDFKIFF